MIITIIGTEGVGKTSTASEAVKMLRSIGNPAVHLDGDLFRRMTGNRDYSEAGRFANALGLGAMARTFDVLRYNVLVSAVFPSYLIRRQFRDVAGDVMMVHLNDKPLTARAHGRTEMTGLDLEPKLIELKREHSALRTAQAMFALILLNPAAPDIIGWENMPSLGTILTSVDEIKRIDAKVYDYSI